MFGAFIGYIGKVLIEDDAPFACKCDEALAAGAANQRQIRLACKLDTPGGETRARDENRYAHSYCLDHHFRGEPSGGVEDLVGWRHPMLEHPAGNLVHRIVAADILHIDQRAILDRKDTAVNG